MANKDTFIDPTTGKKYKLSDFNETRSWSKAKKKTNIKENTAPSIPNLLGKV